MSSLISLISISAFSTALSAPWTQSFVVSLLYLLFTSWNACEKCSYCSMAWILFGCVLTLLRRFMCSQNAVSYFCFEVALLKLLMLYIRVSERCILTIWSPVSLYVRRKARVYPLAALHSLWNHCALSCLPGTSSSMQGDDWMNPLVIHFSSPSTSVPSVNRSSAISVR